MILKAENVKTGAIISLLVCSDRGPARAIATVAMSAFDVVKLIAALENGTDYRQDDMLSLVWCRGHIALSVQSECIGIRQAMAKEFSAYLRSDRSGAWLLEGNSE